jgi:geranylgeranyl pyrophosphate synthase
MDDDALRRGKPTAHIAFNEATAILAGDALLTGAFELLSNTHSSAVGALVQIFSQAAGANGMVAGQMYDLFPTDASAPLLESFMHCYRLKTGCLFAAALEAGATFSTGHRHPPLKAVGEHLGILFQVRDDIVEAIEDPALWQDASTALPLMSENEWQKWCSNLFQSAAHWTHDPNAVLLNHLIHNIMFSDFPDAFKEFCLQEPC